MCADSGLQIVCFFDRMLCIASREPKSRPRGSKTHPRGPKEPPRGPKSTPGGPKNNPRDPGSRSRGLKIFQDRPSRLQNTPKTWRDTIPKTIADINVADIAEIDKNLKRFTRGAVVNGRAGGGVPPWGRQSAARPVGVEQHVLDRQQNLYIVKL